MTTGSELTPQERMKTFRSLRANATLWLVLGAAFFALGIFALTRHQPGFYGYADLVFGVAGLGLARYYWTSARKFA